MCALQCRHSVGPTYTSPNICPPITVTVFRALQGLPAAPPDGFIIPRDAAQTLLQPLALGCRASLRSTTACRGCRSETPRGAACKRT